MTKEESLAARKPQFVADQDTAVTNLGGGSYDDGYTQGFAIGVASVVVGPGGVTQEQMDAAVQAVKDADAQALALVQAQDAQVLADAVAAKDKAMADLQAAFDALAVKDQADIAAGIGKVKDAQDKLVAAKASWDAIMAIVLPPAA